MVNAVEYLGKSGDEQAFKINQVIFTIYNHKTMKVIQCSHCPRDCEHEYLIDMALENQENYPSWINEIMWVWNYDDGEFPYNFRSRYFALWGLLTGDLIGSGHRRRKNIELYHRDVMEICWEYNLPFKSKEDREKIIKWDEKVHHVYSKYDKMVQDWYNDMLSTVNYFLKYMNPMEIAHLSLMGEPPEINEDDLIPEWKEAKDYAIRNILFVGSYMRNDDNRGEKHG